MDKANAGINSKRQMKKKPDRQTDKVIPLINPQNPGQVDMQHFRGYQIIPWWVAILLNISTCS